MLDRRPIGVRRVGVDLASAGPLKGDSLGVDELGSEFDGERIESSDVEPQGRHGVIELAVSDRPAERDETEARADDGERETEGDDDRERRVHA